MDEIISAQIVLKWTAAPKNAAATPVTSKTIGDYKLDEVASTSVMAFFTRNKFKVGTLTANNFSISASKQHFQFFFHVEIHRLAANNYLTYPDKDSKLPLGKLPEEIRNLIDYITFVEPPSLHQDKYSY